MAARKKRGKRSIIIILLLMVIAYFGVPFFGGYYWTESAASQTIYPYGYEPEYNVYEKEFGNKKVTIQDTGGKPIASLVENPFGLMYRIPIASEISAETQDGKMNITWHSSQIENDRYDVLLAVEVLDEDIKKVIVTNEYSKLETASLDELQKLSDLYIEMNVEDRYAAHYAVLPYSEATFFVFRGIDEDGNIVSIF